MIETIENLGTDGQGKYRTLEGKTTTFSLRACPPSVEVTDASAIPAEYKTLTLPALTFEQLLDGLDIEQRAAVLGQVKIPEVAADKRSIKTAIDDTCSGSGPFPVPCGDDSYHKLGPRKFAALHRLNMRAIAARLSAKPLIRVESGCFVGRFGDQEYELGSTEVGLARAIRRMSELRRETEAEVA